MPLRLNALLRDEGLDPRDVRLVRHETKSVPGRTPYGLWRDDRPGFDAYQTVQNTFQRPRLNSRYWATFVVPPGEGAMFAGLYEASLVGPADPEEICPLSRREVGLKNDKHPCRRLPLLEELAGRLFVDWGPGVRVLGQRADRQDKVVIELKRTFHEDAFPGFTTFMRPLSEIETMPTSWKEALRASRGVYLLACRHRR